MIPLIEKVMILKGSEFFRNFPGSDLGGIAALADVVYADPGEVIFEQGDEGDAFFVVVQGAIKIARGDYASEARPGFLRPGGGGQSGGGAGNLPRADRATEKHARAGGGRLDPVRDPAEDELHDAPKYCDHAPFYESGTGEVSSSTDLDAAGQGLHRHRSPPRSGRPPAPVHFPVRRVAPASV